MYRPDTPPREDIWRTCAQCATPLVPLRDFEIHQSSESPVVGAEGWQILLFGWWALVVNYVSDFFTQGQRVSRLAKLKNEVLPQFPDSQVCPRCLKILCLP